MLKDKFKNIKYSQKKNKPIKDIKNKIPLRIKIVNNTKLLFKDIKRSRWADIIDNRKTFIKVALFIVVISLVLFGIAIGFSTLWNSLGVGANG